jgi:hypothetical protein
VDIVLKGAPVFVTIFGGVGFYYIYQILRQLVLHFVQVLLVHVGVVEYTIFGNLLVTCNVRASSLI